MTSANANGLERLQPSSRDERIAPVLGGGERLLKQHCRSVAILPFATSGQPASPPELCLRESPSCSDPFVGSCCMREVGFSLLEAIQRCGQHSQVVTDFGIGSRLDTADLADERAEPLEHRSG